jgi:hypothetical protein
MTEMTFQSYLQKMEDAQNEGVPVNWQQVAHTLAGSAQQQMQILQKELGEQNERIADLEDDQLEMEEFTGPAAA